MTVNNHLNVARGFFLIITAAIVILFWKIIEPFAITLLSAGIAAVALGPIDRRLRLITKSQRLSALIMTLTTFVVIGVPLFLTTAGVVKEAAQVVQNSINNAVWLRSLDPHQMAWVANLPEIVREQIYALDPVALGTGAA